MYNLGRALRFLRGRWYFMLVNMNHGAGSCAASKALDFTVMFDNSVKDLLRLNRESGEQEMGPVSLAIYNLAGQRVRPLVDAGQGPGAHRVVWDGTEDTGCVVACGIYFGRLVVREFRASHKLVVVH